MLHVNLPITASWGRIYHKKFSDVRAVKKLRKYYICKVTSEIKSFRWDNLYINHLQSKSVGITSYKIKKDEVPFQT